MGNAGFISSTVTIAFFWGGGLRRAGGFRASALGSALGVWGFGDEKTICAYQRLVSGDATNMATSLDHSCHMSIYLSIDRSMCLREFVPVRYMYVCYEGLKQLLMAVRNGLEEDSQEMIGDIRLMIRYISCINLIKDRNNYGNYGIFLIMGNAGCISSTAIGVAPQVPFEGLLGMHVAVVGKRESCRKTEPTPWLLYGRGLNRHHGS